MEFIQTYRDDFLINHSHKIHNKIVLELAAGPGHISEHLIARRPSKYYVSDNFREFFKSNKLFGNYYDGQVENHMIDILHDLPKFYDSHQIIDTVICCGYLYHTCHPLWAIEQILIGKPKWFYLETSYCMEAVEFYGKLISTCQLGDEIGNISGNHTNKPGEISKHLILPMSMIIESVETLGYVVDEIISRTDNTNIIDDGYHGFWKTKKGIWFSLKD
jgi:hypothetical protein